MEANSRMSNWQQLGSDSWYNDEINAKLRIEERDHLVRDEAYYVVIVEDSSGSEQYVHDKIAVGSDIYCNSDEHTIANKQRAYKRAEQYAVEYNENNDD